MTIPGESACCNVCHVYYDPEYAGPCQEFARSATEDQIVAGTARRCPGTVSLAAAVDVQRSRAVEAERERDEARAEANRLARELGEAQGRLEASEWPGVVDGWKAEVERLRSLIGELYVARGGSRQELYTAIKRAFRAANPEDGER